MKQEKMSRRTGNINGKKLVILSLLAAAAAVLYLFLNVNMKYFSYAMSLRIPKLAVMLITAFCIGGASVIFQSVINNTFVMPCLLGMNSLYTLIHTAVVLVGNHDARQRRLHTGEKGGQHRSGQQDIQHIMACLLK